MESIGRYQIVQELGRGAMGAVYKALDPQIGRTVAIKVILTANLSPKDLENYKQRFYREARAAGKMSHGSIVTIYDITEDATGQPYLVMEYVEGRTLEHVMLEATTAAQPLALARTLEIGRQVADALDYAHRRGVVHRDVKPANILLTEDGVAKIADFGIAKMEGVQLTQTGHMLGTPAFMSPEQFSGGVIDARTDLFSLGSILYWMFTGEKPFHAETLSMVTYKVVFADPPPATQVNLALPADVNTVLGRCIAKKPETRYASCKELADDLEALSLGKPVKARPLTEEEKTVIAPPVGAAEPATIHPEKTVAGPAPDLQRTVAQPAPEPVAVVEKKSAPAKAAAPSGKSAVKKSSFPILRVAAVLLLLFAASVGAWLYWPWQREAPQQPPVVPQHVAAHQPAPDPPAEEKPQETKHAEVKAEETATVATPQAAEPPVVTPPEPVAQKAADPEPTSSASPASSKSKAKGVRNRRAAPAPPIGPKAKLHIECQHNFRDGVLEITSGGRVLLLANLRGKEQDLGLVKIYNGVYNGTLEVPAGDNLFEVRVRSSRSNFNESDQIGGLFAENSARTMLIEFGRGSGFKVVSRKLILRWK